ncbi:hypothetical protein ACTXJ8_07395 [Corynebacterium variabile]|uniref:hypothetical protein n=1 Tax=Corynebacterium variabile TaxID=1727 RepID=UPI003FCF6E08
MTIKKTLFTLGTATAVAIAGTGVASAAEGDETAGSLPSSSDNTGDADGSALLGSVQGSTSDGALDPSGSIDADGFFNQFWEDGETGVISLPGAVAILTGVAGAAASVYGIANAYTAVIDASDAYQGVVNDTLGFLAQQGITLPN